MFKKGFSILELLIVGAIIGILAGIVLPSVGESIAKANDAKLRASLSSLKTDIIIAFEKDFTTIDICNSATLDKYIDAEYTDRQCIQANGDSVFNWSVVVELQSDSGINGKRDYFCIDAEGSNKVITGNGSAGVNDLNISVADKWLLTTVPGNSQSLISANYLCQ